MPFPPRRRDLRHPVLLGALALAMSAMAFLPTPASAMLPVHPRDAFAVKAGSAPARSRVITVKVDPHMFGVHDYNETSLSRPATGSIRLWDSGTQWRELFPAIGVPNWTRLDLAVARAHANDTEVTLVLGLTPAYASVDPLNPSYPTSMPNLTMYRSYVSALMSRYRNFDGYRGIAAYQVWNEANISTFWSGSYPLLGSLVKAVYDVRNAVDPGVKVVGPAMVTRLPYQQAGIRKFYATTVSGVPVWKYMDALSLNLYPLDTYGTRAGTPEDSMRLLAAVRTILAKDGVPPSMPIWNTEVNYGMHTGALGGHAATPISPEMQIAYVMRTYLLNAAQGVQRVDWYAYDMGNLPADVGGAPLGNTLLTDPAVQSAGILTPAGVALSRVESWMHGTMLGTSTARPCSTDARGTYTCVVKYSKTSYGRIYWNPYKTGKVILVTSARQAVNEYGVVRKVKGGQKLSVNYAPTLVRSSK